MNKKPFIERLKAAYDNSEKLLSDGEVLDLVYDWLDRKGTIPELRKLLHANEPIEFTSEPQVNPQGIPITYENKDELSAEDIESSRSDK